MWFIAFQSSSMWMLLLVLLVSTVCHGISCPWVVSTVSAVCRDVVDSLSIIFNVVVTFGTSGNHILLHHQAKYCIALIHSAIYYSTIDPISHILLHNLLHHQAKYSSQYITPPLIQSAIYYSIIYSTIRPNILHSILLHH